MNEPLPAPVPCLPRGISLLFAMPEALSLVCQWVSASPVLHSVRGSLSVIARNRSASRAALKVAQ